VILIGVDPLPLWKMNRTMAPFLQVMMMTMTTETSFQMLLWSDFVVIPNSKCQRKNSKMKKMKRSHLVIRITVRVAVFPEQCDLSSLLSSPLRRIVFLLGRQVHFRATVVTAEFIYPRPSDDDFFRLYYSAHELQRLRDQYKIDISSGKNKTNSGDTAKNVLVE